MITIIIYIHFMKINKQIIFFFLMIDCWHSLVFSLFFWFSLVHQWFFFFFLLKNKISIKFAHSTNNNTKQNQRKMEKGKWFLIDIWRNREKLLKIFILILFGINSYIAVEKFKVSLWCFLQKFLQRRIEI